MTDADVGRSDHVNVVGSVADGERGGVLLLVLDQIDDFCLLLGETLQARRQRSFG